MFDFVRIVSINGGKKGTIKVRPDFIVNTATQDLMIKGGDFYAVWDERTGLWSTKEQTVIDIVDKAVMDTVSQLSNELPSASVEPCLMRSSSSGVIDQWHKFCQKQMRDNYHQLDENVVFADTETKREDYASRKLPYCMAKGDMNAYNELMETLYSAPEQRQKLEWTVGAVISGDSKHIQKFLVLYGDKGTGKGTWTKIVRMMFDGYVTSFNAKKLGIASNAFPMESLKNNPLIAIQEDGDLSRIEDNTIINSLVSHEFMEVNAKYTKIYQQRFNTFLIIGSNKPVKITDAKSGILRRLIDVHPSGNKIPYKRYHQLINQVKFELGAIAYHCLDIYKQLGEDFYEHYVPVNMMAETNDFYNFVEYHYEEYSTSDFITLTEAWKQYKEYCDFANCPAMNWRPFRIELGNYFSTFEERKYVDGKQLRSVYSGFLASKFDNEIWKENTEELSDNDGWLKLDKTTSLFDEIFADAPAQGCKADGSPAHYWKNVKTKLRDIDTSKLHWVLPGKRLICIDFDIKGADGKKLLKENLKAANKWTPTYAEVSKSGQAIHLYYYYDGDVSLLSELFAPNIEIKTFDGLNALRRIVTKCNDLPIATLTGGLPLKKGDTNVLDRDQIKDVNHLRNIINKALAKKTEHADTTSNIHLIKKVLDDAYDSGMTYDLSDMEKKVLDFAFKSTNQKAHCVNVVGEMKFKSDHEEVVEAGENHVKIRSRAKAKDGRIVFFDIEIYRPDKKTNNPGLFLICWKYRGAKTVQVMVNPKPHEVEELFEYLLAGFNNLSYDNPMLYAASIGYSNQQLYELSQDIIVNHSNQFKNVSKDISYIDVFDMCTEKMGLKKWEYRLGIDHKEMGIPWDQPAPVERWDEIIEYCKNDVIATEAVFEANQGDYKARLFQVDLAKILHGDDIDVSPNDTTNTLSKRIIFGKNKTPQNEFNYRDLSKPVGSNQYEEYRIKFGPDYRFRVFDEEGLPLYRDYKPGEVLPDGYSILPFFPGYTCARDPKTGKYVSTYLGEKIGEGGRVYSKRGYYEWVWDGDISSQHPHSIIAEMLFGPRYTPVFKAIVDARVAVKHKDFETALTLLNGALEPFLNEEDSSSLAQALKIVINSIYGLTKAGFKNEFRDPRNFDNIVAKRGALFMTLLKREVEKRGAFVCHIKTDSIKIPGASDEVKDFVVKFGREFGYEFETEGTFVKFALFNDAAYLAMEENGNWITKADQFKKEKQPFLYKTLFTHEPYTIDDCCEVKSVTDGALYLDMNEQLGEPVEDILDKKGKKLASLRKKRYEKLRPLHPELSELGVRELVDKESDISSLNDECCKLYLEVLDHHDYQFVGRVGQFTPVIAGAGGGVLYRKTDDDFVAASGSKGYRWLESADVKKYGKLEIVDISYYRKRVDDARDAIRDVLSESGSDIDVDTFLSDFIPEKKLMTSFGIAEDCMNRPEVA